MELEMIRKENLAMIGQFTKPHGIKGELTFVTNYSRLFENADDPYVVCEMDGAVLCGIVPVEEYFLSVREAGESKR